MDLAGSQLLRSSESSLWVISATRGAGRTHELWGLWRTALGESNVPVTALWVGIVLSDFCVNSFELLRSTTAGYYQLSFHSHSSILSIQSVSFP